MTTLDGKVPQSQTFDEAAVALGRLVREVWVAWARGQRDPKPSWLIPWEELDDGQREVDIWIGCVLYAEGLKAAGCGCEGECDHLPYDRLSKACVNLGKALDEAMLTMGEALGTASAKGAEAGIRVIRDYYQAIAHEAGTAEPSTRGAGRG